MGADMHLGAVEAPRRESVDAVGCAAVEPGRGFGRTSTEGGQSPASRLTPIARSRAGCPPPPD
jgi:hypothetical protein